MKRVVRSSPIVLALVLLVSLEGAAFAGEWTHWRGPQQNGVSPETGLVSSWSKDGTNLIWRDDFVGRSTPIVFDGRACAIGRAGEGILRQEAIACWDAGSGKKLWERRFIVRHTAVPWNRVGWASIAGDAETGNLYAQGVDGHFVALDRDGKTVWMWSLGEDLGRFSGYGGRTNTPVVDEDQVIAHLINSGWGKGFGPGGDRYISFDKHTGTIRWVTERLAPPEDLNTYSTPVIAEIGGRRLMIAGGSGGWIHAVEARTGREVWRFHLSQRGLNSSVAVAGNLVFAGQSEENVDEGTMGRVVAIDGTGTGDVTKTHEAWRANELAVGYSSILYHDGVVYAVDNSANLQALDAKTGAKKWEHSLGTVGKGSPVWADGKIYATEVNGNFLILKADADGAETLDTEHLEMPDGHRYAELYSSPAIAYGRIYFTTEEGIYCLGDKSKEFTVTHDPAPMAPKPMAEGGKAAWVQVVPAVVVTEVGEPISFVARLYDGLGNFLGEKAAEWSVAKVPGTISADGTLSFDAEKIRETMTGTVTAKVGDVTGTAMLRVAGALPWSEDFEDVAEGQRPDGWLGIGIKAKVVDQGGNKVLDFYKPDGGAPRAYAHIGPSSLSNYTIQADVMGTQQGRRRSDVGIFNSGYTADLQGNHQRLQIRSWASELRMMQQIDFPWDPDVWYTMKLRVDTAGSGADEKAIVKAKVWKRGDAEPTDWTFTVEDPLPIKNGSPGLYAFTPTDSYVDNVKVEVTR